MNESSSTLPLDIALVFASNTSGLKLDGFEGKGRVTPEIIKSGDESGNKMVVKYRFPDGSSVYGIGVPQAWETALGPTWSYVVEADVLTLIDTGCNGSIQYLEEGLEWIGYPITAVGRVLVTHGHMDHDGSCFHVVAKSGAELWAHEVYGALVGLNRWEVEKELRQSLIGLSSPSDDPEDRIVRYEELRHGLTVTKAVADGVTSDGFTFFYTPGHSPDELCILLGGVLFSGDHILPQITPHPSVGLTYQGFRESLPDGYRQRNRCYGLKAYLRSLKKVSTLGDDVAVLPAHRAFHRGRFNSIGLERAPQIIEHHRSRCHDILDILKQQSLSLKDITTKHFSSQQLGEGNFYSAFTEALSHVELLEEAGDVSLTGDRSSLVTWNGTEDFSRFIDELTPDGDKSEETP